MSVRLPDDHVAFYLAAANQLRLLGTSRIPRARRCDPAGAS